MATSTYTAENFVVTPPLLSSAEVVYKQPINWAGKSVSAKRCTILELDTELNDDDGIVSLGSNILTLDALTYPGNYAITPYINALNVSGLFLDFSFYLRDSTGAVLGSATGCNGNTDLGRSFVMPTIFKYLNASIALYMELSANAAGSLKFNTGATAYTAGKAVTGITRANPGVVTAASHGKANGDTVWIRGVSGMTQVNNKPFTVANQTLNTFELSGVDTTGYTAWSSGGTVEYAPDLIAWGIKLLRYDS